MDEATANIDMKTDLLIQKAIKEILVDSTVITIAHRIKTIMSYDKILVLDKGEIIEFDSVENLMNDQSSEFFKLNSQKIH
jgi:ABC-type multidrug transport system fused ATPase/permease subunit